MFESNNPEKPINLDDHVSWWSKRFKRRFYGTVVELRAKHFGRTDKGTRRIVYKAVVLKQASPDRYHYSIQVMRTSSLQVELLK